MPGPDVLRRAKSDPTIGEVRFIVVSGSIEEYLSDEDRKLANTVIEKPFDLDRLFAEVERLCAPVTPNGHR